uniref:Uncharacterized protein n=1 Tax=Pithovirus LCPAC406 TaxID=2506599 RepID=A0A481ZFN8_9VIRU|nr:MAG: hypothetical protein LCPAC406_02460 [Pithovirus LCPAC406]
MFRISIHVSVSNVIESKISINLRRIIFFWMDIKSISIQKDSILKLGTLSDDTPESIIPEIIPSNTSLFFPSK